MRATDRVTDGAPFGGAGVSGTVEALTMGTAFAGCLNSPTAVGPEAAAPGQDGRA